MQTPKWFDLEKYKNAECFSPEDWLRNLSLRLGIYRLVDWKLNYNEDYPPEVWNELVCVIESTQFNPYTLPLEFTNGLSEYFFTAGAFDCMGQDIDTDKNNLPVRILTQHDISEVMTDRFFKKKYRKEHINFVQNIDSKIDAKSGDEIEIEWSDLYSIFAEPRFKGELAFAESKNLFIKLDLNLSNTILINMLTELINRYRIEFDIPNDKSRDTTIDYTRFNSSQILPYCDLKIWSLLNENHIVDRIMCNLIFPEGDKGESNLNKTTKKHFEELISLELTNKILLDITRRKEL